MADPGQQATPDLSQYDPAIQAAAKEWGQDPVMLKALILQESGGRPGQTSSAGARGLTQILPSTATGLGMTDPNDPTQQIFGAAKYLAQGFAKEGTPEGALLYYHGGPDWRKSYGPESQGYVPGVAAHYSALSAAAQPGAAPPNGASAGTPPGAGIPSDADFLKSVAPGGGTASASPAIPSDADFLKQAGSAATAASPGTAPAEAPAAAATPSTTPASLDPLSAVGEVAPLQRIGDAAIGGVAEGFGSAPLGLSPQSTQALRDAGVYSQPGAPFNPLRALNEAVINPLAYAGEAAYRGAAGLLRGGQAAVAQTGAEVGAPQLGTTLAAIPESFGPEAAAHAPVAAIPENLLRDRAALAAAGESHAAALRAVLPDNFRENPLAAGAAERMAAAPAGPTEANPAFSPSALRPGPGLPPTAPAVVAEPLTGPASWSGAPAAPPRAAAASTYPTVAPRLKTAAEGGDGLAMTNIAPEDYARFSSGLPYQRASTPAQPGGAGTAGAAQGPGAPVSAGAAGSTAAEAAMTPAQTKAYRRMAELADATAPAPSGLDNTTYVAGSVPTEAEYSGNAAISQRETLQRQRDPTTFEGPNGVLTQNSAARVRAYDDLAGTDVQRENIASARAAQATVDSQAVMRSAQPADAAPAMAQLQSVLQDTRAQNRDTVMRFMQPFAAKLVDADGALKTDPAALWGIRDDVAEKLQAIQNDPKNPMGYVKKELMDFKDSLDGVLNNATGGSFQTYLDNYARSSQQINAMELLQKQRNTLTDSKGNILAPQFNRFVTNLAQRRGGPGIDPAMDIPDDTMRGLLDINRDLKRAGNIDLGKARGSPTNLLGALAESGGIGAAHLGTMLLDPTGIGNLVVHKIGQVAAPIIQRQRLRAGSRRALAPPPGGFNDNYLKDRSGPP